jgi:hypothetical protein
MQSFSDGSKNWKFIDWFFIAVKVYKKWKYVNAIEENSYQTDWIIEFEE